MMPRLPYREERIVLQGVRVEDAQVYQLPGRQVSYLVGPKTTDAKNVTVGLCVWPQGGQPYHVHNEHEETIYIISGRGEISCPDNEVALEPGTAVFIPRGTDHRIESFGPEPLQFVTIFAPPVIFGDYK
jgi:mannose-6-phosphate isomerase-like protein (cupin superfamily)